MFDLSIWKFLNMNGIQFQPLRWIGIWDIWKFADGSSVLTEVLMVWVNWSLHQLVELWTRLFPQNDSEFTGPFEIQTVQTGIETCFFNMLLPIWTMQDTLDAAQNDAEQLVIDRLRCSVCFLRKYHKKGGGHWGLKEQYVNKLEGIFRAASLISRNLES